MSDIPHTPWFIRPRPTDSGLAVIENGTESGSHIAECEWHIAEFIVQTVNEHETEVTREMVDAAFDVWWSSGWVESKAQEAGKRLVRDMLMSAMKAR